MQSFAGEHFGMPGAPDLFKRWKRVRSLLVEGALDILF
jgi:hypothetical protein